MNSTWRVLRIYAAPPVLRMLWLGFGSGLPLLLVFGTLSFWLSEAGVARTTIGFVSWVALAYAVKFAWAPVVDQLALPWLGRRLGRRRSWLLAAQLVVIGGLLGMAATDPAADLARLVACALVTAFASATQDVALDAYRIESAPAEQQAALAAAYQAGYRAAMIWAGAGALWLAARADQGAPGYHPASWAFAYRTMALTMLVGIVAVLLAPEPVVADGTAAPATDRLRVGPANTRADRYPCTRWTDRPRHALARFAGVFIGPLADFLHRHGRRAVTLLALIATFRIADIVMGVMANPFYHDLGFTKDEVAAVSKVFGVLMTLAGAFVGGALAPRIGVLRTLFAGASGAVASNLLFALLALRGHDLAFLVLAISADNIAAGIAGSAFIAFMSGLTDIRYSATQYALLSSMMLLLPKYVAGFSGLYVEHFGYVRFFCTTALLGVPALFLVWLVARQARAAHRD